jgi:hypothetical protein
MAVFISLIGFDNIREKINAISREIAVFSSLVVTSYFSVSIVRIPPMLIFCPSLFCSPLLKTAFYIIQYLKVIFENIITKSRYIR